MQKPRLFFTSLAFLDTLINTESMHNEHKIYKFLHI